jgi:hypothetical protein
LYIAAALSSIQTFLNYEKKAEQHRRTSIRFTALFNNIKRTLAINPEHRQKITEYFHWVNKEFDNILESAPPIINNKETSFRKEYNINMNDFVSCNTKQKDDIGNKKMQVDLETHRLAYEMDRFMDHVV